MINKPQKRLFLIAISALFAGCIFYLLFRRTLFMAATSPYFSEWDLLRSVSSLNFIAIQSVPSFIHVFSYSILSTLVFQVLTLRVILNSCFAWTLINIAFELGQMISPQQVETLASHPYHLLPAPVYQYFLSGTFDWWDIVFCAGGGVTALFVLLFFAEKR